MHGRPRVGRHPGELSVRQHRDTGSIDLVSPFGGFASLITFDGGTGAMSNATGQIRLRGEFSASEGTTAGDYLGTLCSQ